MNLISRLPEVAAYIYRRYVSLVRAWGFCGSVLRVTPWTQEWTLHSRALHNMLRCENHEELLLEIHQVIFLSPINWKNVQCWKTPLLLDFFFFRVIWEEGMRKLVCNSDKRIKGVAGYIREASCVGQIPIWTMLQILHTCLDFKMTSCMNWCACTLAFTGYVRGLFWKK
jgi:hypothetical protein